MATVLRNVSVMVDGNVLTDSADEVTITEEADQQDSTTFGTSGYRTFELGLITGTIQVRFNQDFAADGVHDVLYPLWTDRRPFQIRIGPDGDDAGSTNPVYIAEVKMFAYSFLQGSVGEISRNPVTFALVDAPSLDNT